MGDLVVPMSELVAVGNGSAVSSKSYLSDSEMDALAIITLFSGGISLLGASSVFLCSLVNRRVCYPEIFPTFHLSMADMFSALFLVVSSTIFLMSHMSYPGAPGPCGYIMTMVTCFYTTTFLLTIAYAIEALFRFRRRLTDGVRLDAVNVRVVSNKWMYLIYALCWLIPLSVAAGLMLVTHNLKDMNDYSSWATVLPKQCTSCFPTFRFNEQICWGQVEDGPDKHKLIRLLFLLPLLMVMVINMVLYVMIARTFRQVAMRRGLLSYHQRQEEGLLRRKAALYQGVFCICWLPSVILGFISFMDGYSMADNYWLLVLQAILGPLQGLLNSILYGWKRDSFRRALSERSSLLSTNRSNTICDCFRQCRKRGESPTSMDVSDLDNNDDKLLGREEEEEPENLEESIKNFRSDNF